MAIEESGPGWYMTFDSTNSVRRIYAPNIIDDTMFANIMANANAEMVFLGAGYGTVEEYLADRVKDNTGWYSYREIADVV